MGASQQDANQPRLGKILIFFWRKDSPLTEQEQALWIAVATAHNKSAFRENLSSDAVVRSALGSGDYFKALAAGLLTLGGLHGPVEQATLLLSQPIEEIRGFVDEAVSLKARVPGWGNSFHKGQKDENWLEAETVLFDNFSEWSCKLDNVTSMLHERGKKIYPNPAAYTAVTALILKAPLQSAGFLFVLSRLSAWSEIFQANVARI